MPAPTPQWTEFDTDDYETDDVLTEATQLVVLENVHHLGTSHPHDGSAGSGGVIQASDPLAIRIFGAISWSGPFA